MIWSKFLKYSLILSLPIGNIYFFKISSIGIYDIPMTPFLFFSILNIANSFCTFLVRSRSIIYINLFNLSIFSYIFLVSAINIKTARLTTIIYFLLNVCIYFIIINYLKRLSLKTFYNLLTFVIYGYFFVILISLFTYILSPTIAQLLFRTAYTLSAEYSFPRFFGFALEPSLAAFVVLVSYFVLIVLSHEHSIKLRKIIHICIIFIVFASNSGYGYLLYMIITCYNLLVIHKKRYILYFASPVIFYMLIRVLENSRLQGLLQFLYSFDLSTIDPSAAIRVLPLIDYMFTFKKITIHHFIGNGLGSSTDYFYHLYYYLTDANTFNAFLAELFYDIGIIGVVLLFYLFVKNINKKYIFISLAIYILLLFNSGINTQVYWWVVILLFSLAIYDKNSIEPRIGNTLI